MPWYGLSAVNESPSGGEPNAVWADKVKSINAQLASDIQAENDKYENALKSREDSLYKSYGLFDAVKERDEVSGDTLMKNLEGQVKEFGEWQDILESLAGRGLDSGLIEELQDMGPDAIAQIKALNNMSDSELEKYAFQKILKENNLRRIRFHDLRHSSAGILISNRVPLVEVQQWLGHSTIRITADLYTHLEYEIKKRSAAVMSDILFHHNFFNFSTEF